MRSVELELTLRDGAVANAIAREEGVSARNLYRWRAQYRAGELVESTGLFGSKQSAAALLPVWSVSGLKQVRRRDRCFAMIVRPAETAFMLCLHRARRFTSTIVSTPI